MLGNNNDKNNPVNQDLPDCNEFFQRLSEELDIGAAAPGAMKSEVEFNDSNVSSSVEGTYHGKSIEINTNLTIKGNLILIAERSIKINASIIREPEPNDNPTNIIIISLQGNVHIDRNASIGFDANGNVSLAEDGIDSEVFFRIVNGSPFRDFVSPTPGKNGSLVYIRGRGITVYGSIASQGGGNGGAGILRPREFQTIWPQRLVASQAIGAMGGTGGVVWFCAEDQIHLDRFAEIIAGKGGDGGYSLAIAHAGGSADAYGGGGNNGGDIVLHGGDSKPCKLNFFAGYNITGGNGGKGGDAEAFGEPQGLTNNMKPAKNFASDGGFAFGQAVKALDLQYWKAACALTKGLRQR